MGIHLMVLSRPSQQNHIDVGIANILINQCPMYSRTNSVYFTGGKRMGDISENVRNAFDCVLKIYEETTFLLNDFTEELAAFNFVNLSPNSIGTHDVSKSMQWPKFWMVRYGSQFYKQKKQDINNPLLSLTVGFLGYSDGGPNVIEPFLAIGVIRGMDHPNQGWQNWWLYHPVINLDGAYEYDPEDYQGQPYVGDRKNRYNIINFKCRRLDTSYDFPKEGSFFTTPLLSINDTENIKELSKKCFELWSEKTKEWNDKGVIFKITAAEEV